MGRFFLLVIIIVMPFAILTLLFNTARALDPPIHIHLTWQNDTNTTMTVTWQTSLPNSGDFVFYDNISRGGVASTYNYNTTGINFTYLGASGYIHVVELTGLTPNTVYYFICGGPVEGYSNERSFRTAPSSAVDVRFVAGGDSRSQPAQRELISQAMATFNPSFVMHSGDMISTGTSQAQWDTWFNDLHNNWIGDNNLTIPIIPAIGNHEGNSINYYSQFALPGNEMWYSYNWGPDIHISVLSTSPTVPGAQTTWLEADLAAHANYTWKFAVFHIPAFPATRPAGHPDVVTEWIPLFDKYHVDIFFVGHDHAYLRSKPINWTASQTEPQLYKNGTMQVVSGGWGAPLYTLQTHWYDAYGAQQYHFCLVDVFTNGSLHIQAKNNLGTTFDEAWIIKNESLPLNVSINLTAPTETVHDSLPIDLTWSTTGIIDHYKVYIDGQFQKYQHSMLKSYQITSLSEGNHTIDVVAFDPLGNAFNATTEISYDLTPPTTTDDYDGLWHSTDFTITLNASDSISGTAETYYRINDDAINNVSGNGQPYIITEGANNKLEYWSIDNANNEELPHVTLTTIKLDKTAPIADGGGNQTIEVGTLFTFNGSASTDNVSITNYTWSFIDITPKNFTGKTVPYTFNSTGLYEVTLNVTDNIGWWNTDIIWINVTDSSEPVANFTVPDSVIVGAYVIFNASNSTDNAGISTYLWDFGDGTQISTSNPIIAHTYSTHGVFLVNLTVTDEANNSASTTLIVKVGLGGEGQFKFPWWLTTLILVELGIILPIIYWDLKRGLFRGKKTFRHLSPS